jgi:predicted flap endonuclease-1-like 5' DNA nuclease
MANFSCCWAWFLGGLLAGWLLWQLFDQWFRRDGARAGMQYKHDLDTANTRARQLQVDLDARNATLKSHSDDTTKFTNERNELKSKIAELQSQLSGAQVRVEQVTSEANVATTAAATIASVATAAATSVSSAANYGFNPQVNGKDNLQVIEGIGVKISELLIAGGITTFAQLASAPTAAVKDILDTAGPNFRLANPGSWSKQADLCAKQDWEALRKYQDAMIAGRDPNAPHA